MLWGTAYVVTTELLPPGRPLLAAALRALPAGVVLVASTPRLPRGDWWWRSAVLGTLKLRRLLLAPLHRRLPTLGRGRSDGRSDPAVGRHVLGRNGARRTRRRHKVAAGFVGLAGVGLLVVDGSARLDAVRVMAALAGAVSTATGTVLVQRWGRPVGALPFAGWQLTAGGVLLLPLALIVEGPPAP